MVMRAKVRGEELFKWGRERASPRTSNGLARRMKEGHSKLWRKRRGGKAVWCVQKLRGDHGVQWEKGEWHSV